MDYEKKRQKKNLGCMQKGPGPQYELKTLIGFDEHDPSRYRNPAYTMKFRPKPKHVSTGPGPYPITQYLTHRGLGLPPAYTIALRHEKAIKSRVPGPGAYAPEKGQPMNHHRRAAAYTILLRHDKTRFRDGPGPIYMLPTCIGPEIPDIRAEGAYTMAFRHRSKRPPVGPGPAAYQTDLNIYKKKCPAYSIKLRHHSVDSKRSFPGPQYSYNTNVFKKRQPQYSFGLKHSECTTVPLVEEDEM